MEELVYKVSQVGEYLKRIIDSENLLHNISIQGEIGSTSVSNGIMYFTLKDEYAAIQCICFKSELFANAKSGEQVVVTGSASYYSKGGRLSFTVTNLIPYGKGLLYKNYLELKDRLEKEGLFASEHKKLLPKFVKRVGVVTSQTGAVIHDIINVTTRRNNGVDLVLYPVKVQGIGAEQQIAEGINFFSTYKDIDVVIVARGGGSFEDLMPFNTEIVARACYNCSKPIVSAVGHETDFSICDFVCDLRAPTPSAAAELVVFDKSKILENLKTFLKSIISAQVSKYKLTEEKVNRQTKIILNSALNSLDKKQIGLHNLATGILSKIDVFIQNKEEQLRNTEKMINLCNPKNILKKGYAKVECERKVVTSINQIEEGSEIVINLFDGSFTSVVKAIKGEN